MNSKQIASYAMYIALAFIMSYIESLIPMPVPIPGIKLGIANIIIIIALYKKSVPFAFLLTVLRCILVSFTFGNLYSLMYSLAGGLLSLTIMALAKRFIGKLTIISISAMGGISHTMAQLGIAGLFVGYDSLAGYAPILYFSGLITGTIIGIISNESLKRIKKEQP